MVWKSTNAKTLLLVLLNNQTMIIRKKTVPILCQTIHDVVWCAWLQGMMCQIAHTTPKIILAFNAPLLSCKGSIAYPLQPISSPMAPIKYAIKKMQIDNSDNGCAGNNTPVTLTYQYESKAIAGRRDYVRANHFLFWSLLYFFCLSLNIYPLLLIAF